MKCRSEHENPDKLFWMQNELIFWNL